VIFTYGADVCMLLCFDGIKPFYFEY